MRKDLPLVYCSEMPIRCFRLFIFTMLFSTSRRFCLWDVFLWLSPNYREIFYRIISGDSMQEQKQEYMRRRWRWPSVEPVTSTRIRWSAASSSRTEKSSVKAGTSTSAACMPSAMRSRTAPEDCTGADLYVTLEPCCHWGRTPPCTDAVIEHKIGRVFVGCLDPNPLVAGKGAQILRDAGIEVETGVCEDECRRVNEVFFHYITHKTPFVTLKYAMTLDGKIARAHRRQPLGYRRDRPPSCARNAQPAARHHGRHRHRA